MVIGGIGVRAAAFIPLFEFLDEAQIEPDLVIGSSGGAFVAAMMAQVIHPKRCAGSSMALRNEALLEG
ncbi:MAG: patatin-like phospholipase family protein [Acidobacteria bacterium]|nr:patatin-like phospholipase family protein [Acidobacteriota bacterium]